MKKPIFKVVIKPIEKEIEIVSEFLLDKNQNFAWLFDFFNIDLANFNNLNIKNKEDLIRNEIEQIYKKEEKNFITKIKDINYLINKNYDFIINEFAKIFNNKYEDEEVYSIEIGVKPICPRFLNEKSFDLSVSYSVDYMLQVIIHEMLHFYWFDKFKEILPEIKREEFEMPNLPWVLSEIVVDPIMKNTELKKFLVNNPAYNIFYKTKIKDKNLLDVFNNLYNNSQNISDFILISMNFVNKNKTFFKNLANNC